MVPESPAFVMPTLEVSSLPSLQKSRLSMEETPNTVRVSIDLPLDPGTVFPLLIDELSSSLAARGIQFDPGCEGRFVEDASEIGRVIAWKPGELLACEWHPASWEPQRVTQVALRLEAISAGTRVTIEQVGWGTIIQDPLELTGWFATEVAAPLLRATSPLAFGDWFTDRRARRPSGVRAAATYRDPLYHWPSFRVMLAELALQPTDYLLDVGCGGGAFLKEALRSGCRAAGVDHSSEMVRLCRRENQTSIDQDRLTILEADAGRLPFPDALFTSTTMHGVLGFLPDPVAVLTEMRRVLRSGGKMVALGTDPELKGTPACPEPVASRLRFYDDVDLLDLARAAGWNKATVLRRNLTELARKEGIPEEHLTLFSGHDARILVGQKE
jgi:SAM-dependent methyltransferase